MAGSSRGAHPLDLQILTLPGQDTLKIAEASISMLLHVHRPGRSTATRRPSLVFLHAFPVDAGMWKHQMLALEDRIDVIAVQFPGFGESPREAGGGTLAGWAECLRSTLTNLGVGEVVLAGCSMGGYVAMECYRQWSHRIAALVLCDTRADADDPAARARREDVIARVESEGMAFLPDTAVNGLLSESTRLTQPTTVDSVRDMVSGVPVETYIAAQRAIMDRADSTGLLRQIRVPTLVLCGEHDMVTPPAMMESMARSIPGASFGVIPSAGHLAPLEQPDAVIRELNRFLDAMGAAALARVQRQS